MEQYSINEANRINLDRMPLYAKKPIKVYKKIFWGAEPVTNEAQQILNVTGYLGVVNGVSVNDGVIYFKVDDENVYNDGYYFYVAANKNEVITNEADAPPPQVTWVDAVTDVVNSAGKSLGNIMLWGLGFLTIGWVVKSIAQTAITKEKK